MSVGEAAAAKSAILATFLTALIFAVPYFFGYSNFGHDFPSFLIHAQQAGSNLRDGVLLPTWAGDLNAGFGSPVLLFYPPLVGMIHGAGLALGFPLARSISVLTFVAHALSGLALFFALRGRGERPFALWAALGYMIAPYRILDIFQRSALAEHWSFVFPPVILLAGWLPGVNWRVRCVLAALGTAGLLLTNLPQSILFSPLLAAWLLSDRQLRGRRLSLVAGALLGVGLSCFALLPQARSHRMLATELMSGEIDPSLQPSSNMLFATSSVSGGREVVPAGGVAFNRSVSVAILTTALVALLSFAMIPSERRRAEMFWLAAVVVMVLLTLQPFAPIWDAAPLFSRVQFPWRICGPITLAMTILTGSVRELRRAVPLLLLTFALALPFAYRSMIPNSFIEVSGWPSGRRGEQFPYARAVAEGGQWSPALRNASLTEPWFIPKALSREMLLSMLGAPTPLLARFGNRPAIMEIAADRTRVEVKRWTALDRLLRVSTPVAGTLLWRTLAFPGMSCQVNGRTVEVFRHPATGLLATKLTAGDQLVSWRWNAIGPFLIGRQISAVSLILLAILIFVSKTSFPRSDPPEMPLS